MTGRGAGGRGIGEPGAPPDRAAGRLPLALARAAVALAALAASAAPALSPAAAQERPSEEELFGAPPEEAPPDPAAARREAGTEDEREARPGSGGEPRPEEAELFGATGSPAATPPPPGSIVPREREDPLRIGGQLYARALSTWPDGETPDAWSFASPTLLDVYLDARPNDRVRAFVLGRMAWDPTLADAGDAATVPGAADPAAPDPGATSDPEAFLDQLWFNFDVGRRVFVTAGRQHVKWGVGRFWNPTDYLHAARRDPLAVFDPRVGTSLVKLHAPWEARGWNAYGIVALEDTGVSPLPTRRLGDLGVGGRLEAVAGTFELGLDALVRDGRKPRFGVDASLGVWEVDLYAEVALRSGTDVPRWRAVPGSTLPGTTLPLVERVEHEGVTPQVVAGGTWSARYSDEDVITLGAEYFYDDTGYGGAELYPQLLAVPFALPGEPVAFSPFYLGRHQAAVFASLPAPGRWNDTTFTLSVLGNLSDRSFVARLDHSVLALTYLRIESFVAGHLGARGGVHRFAVDPALLDLVPEDTRATLGPVDRPPVLDLGVALRVSL